MVRRKRIQSRDNSIIQHRTVTPNIDIQTQPQCGLVVIQSQAQGADVLPGQFYTEVDARILDIADFIIRSQQKPLPRKETRTLCWYLFHKPCQCSNCILTYCHERPDPE